MQDRKGISRILIAVIIIIIILVAGAGAYLASVKSTTTTSQTSSTLASSTSTTTSPATTTSTPPVTTTSSVTSPTTTTNSTSSSSIVLDEPLNPVSTDPRVGSDNAGLEITQNTNLPLLFFNYSDNLNFIPVLATNWTESSNGLTYTFNLRHNVFFSNGDPFNAYVVWYGIYSSLLMAQGGSFILYSFFNSSGVTTGDVNSLDNPQNTPTNSTLLSIMSNSSNDVTVVNPYQVQFHLTNAFAPFLKFAGSPPLNFVDPYVVQQHGGVVANQLNAYMTVNGSSVGDGPYIMQTWVQNQYAILVANPNYWAKNVTNLGTSARFLQVPPIKQVTLNYKTDELTRSLDIEKGNAQGATVSFNDITNVLKAATGTYIPNIGQTGGLEYVTIDSEKGPTNNTLVRRAIIAAVNTTQIQQAAYEGYATPFVGPVPKGVAGYNNSIAAPTYNLTLAKSLLAQAGYPGGAGFPAINFVYPTSDYLSLVGQILVSDLGQIGITVKPQQVSIAIFSTLEFATPGTNASAPILAWGSFSFVPDFAGYEYIVDSQLNLEFYLNNATINQMVNQYNTELNSQQAAKDLSQITYATAQNAVFIWLGQGLDQYNIGSGVGITIWNKCVSGFWYNFGFNGIPYNALSSTCGA